MEENVIDKNYNKRIVHLYILLWILITLIAITGFTMVKYFAKGETNIPFIISKIFIVSSAQTKNLNLENEEYSADIMQINDIYISIENNEKYNKEDAIKEIVIDNFEILEGGNIGDLETYRRNNNLSTYREEGKQEQIKYIGVQKINNESKDLEITNQGGIINFSIVFNNLGNITYSEKENIKIDGTLLNRLNISYENIKSKISFDIKIRLESGNTFYTNVVLDLPLENINTNGVVSNEFEGIQNLVFKRYK